MNKIELVRQLLSDGSIDCLCLSETWLQKLIANDLVSVNGYKLLRKDRITKGGGICCYVKYKYDSEIIPLHLDNSNNLEVLGIKL